MTTKQTILANFNDHQDAFKQLQTLIPDITAMAKKIIKQLTLGHKILLCGNGGSAADCQHIAAELVGRFKTERQALAAIALTTDTSALTAIGNDYDFRNIFARQISGLAQPQDVVWVISTSGQSPNIIAALKEAKKRQCITIGLLGKTGGDAQPLCDLSVTVPVMDTARIQEMHLLIYHTLCDLIDQAFTTELTNTKTQEQSSALTS